MLRCCCRAMGLFFLIVFASLPAVFAAQTAVSDAGTTSIDDANSQQYGVEVSGGNAIVLTVSNGVNINSLTPAPNTDAITTTNYTGGNLTLTCLGTSTFYGNIASSAHPLTVLNAGTAGATDTFNYISDPYTGNANVYATTVNLTGGGTLALGAGVNLTGNVYNTGAPNTGTLTAGGWDVINGSVGTAGAPLATLNLGYQAECTGAVYAQNININSSSSYDWISGNATGTINLLSGAIIIDNSSVTGDVRNTSGTANKGKLVFSSTAAADRSMTGTVGSAAAPLLQVDVDVASGQKVVFSGPIYAQDIDIGQLYGRTGTGEFTGDLHGNLNLRADGGARIGSGVAVSGAITNSSGSNYRGTLSYLGAAVITGNIGSGAATGSLKGVNFNGATSLGANVYAQTTTIAAGTTTVSSPVTVTGALVNNATLNLGTSGLSVTGTYTQSSGSVLSTTISDASTYGRISVSGNATIDAASTLNVLVSGSLPTTATTFTLVDGDGSAGVSLPGTFSVTGSTRRFSLLGSSSGDLLLYLQGLSLAPQTTTPNNRSAAGSLDSVQETATGDMSNVLTTLNNLSAVEMDAAVSTMLPSVGFNPQVPVQLMDSFTGTQMAHLGDAMQLSAANDAGTGISAGDMPAAWTA